MCALTWPGGRFRWRCGETQVNVEKMRELLHRGGLSGGVSWLMARDPVCGMDVDASTAKHTTQHNDQTYYFFTPGCKKALKPRGRSTSTPSTRRTCE